jgi:hypothetical protein
VTRREWAWVIALSVTIIGVVNLPYLVAYAAPASSPHVFSGILFNPLDGNSYFAKMREGFRGEWLFTLPYTAEPGPGVFIFTYYLFLGHLARWTGLGIEPTYHLARLFGGLALLITDYYFTAHFYNSPRSRLAVWLFFAFSSGLGWLAVPFGGFTSDLWVAEAVPFLSLLSNAHFALAWALMLWVFMWTLPGLAPEQPTAGRMVLVALAVTALAQIQPLALITIGMVLAALTLWRIISQKPVFSKKTGFYADLLPLIVVSIFAVPWLIYDFLASATHPLLAGWNAQNLTPSPPLWDALLSGGVPLILALPGIAVCARHRSSSAGDRAPLDLVPLVWLGLTAMALYAPFSLQRRLSLGVWTPLVILAGIGWRDAIWPRLAPRWRPLLLAGVAGASLLSNLLIYVSTLGAILRPDPEQKIFLTRDEADALDWIRDNAPLGALVLAAPTTGIFIPARTDARVIYGHPFETVDAAAQEQAVEDFFSGRVSPQTFLAQYPVDYIFFGPRERALGPLPSLGNGWRILYQQGEVTFYGR